MPRPRRCRIINNKPDIIYFKPAGVPMRELKEVQISFPELEAIRLKDNLKLDQKSSAIRMNISQPTFNRLVLSAREKIADALINGKAIRIEGGNFKYK